MHRHAGRPLSRPELAAMYDAFETPRAVRGDLPLLDRAQALAYLDDVRERVPLEDSFLHDLVLRHEDQHQETMLQAIELARLQPPPAVPRAERPPAPGGHTGLEAVDVPAGPCEIGAPEGRFAYDNERPRHRRRPARLPDRPHADHQRDVPELRRGRRLRAPPVVERRGVGLEGGVRHHTPRGLGPRAHGVASLDDGWLGAASPGRARGACLLVRGRRPRPRARRPAPHRVRVGEGGDLGPGGEEPGNLRRHGPARPGAGGRLPGGRRGVRRARHARRRVGVDLDALPRLRRLRRPPVPRVLRGVLRRPVPRPARRLVGHALARGDARPSATGTSRSGGRSSPE